MTDNVNRPAHYNQSGIEAIDAIKASMSTEEYHGYLKGNCLKYIWRYKYKGKPLEDLLKAEWYLKKLISSVDTESNAKVQLDAESKRLRQSVDNAVIPGTTYDDKIIWYKTPEYTSLYAKPTYGPGYSKRMKEEWAAGTMADEIRQNRSNAAYLGA